MVVMSAAPLEVHIIADSSGESAVRVARAVAAQFEGRDVTYVRHRRMSTPEHVEEAFRILAERQGDPVVVLYTLVDPELVEMVEAACKGLGFPHADLMTPAVRAFETAAGRPADAVARRPVGVETDYFTRVAAIDFAVRNDDGSSPGALRDADIVLVGASRSGKTPLSMYLGYLGYRAANVPLVPGIDPPAELAEVDRWRVVGLTMSPERLQMVRSHRIAGMGGFGTADGYADLAQIYRELEEVGQVQRRLGCPVVDTTGVALEESASRILDVVNRRAQRHGASLRRVPGVEVPRS